MHCTVIMTEVIVRVHSVHLVNVQAAADPQTKPPDLGSESIDCVPISHTVFFTTVSIAMQLSDLYIRF